jgi:hypothetical protein
MEVSDEDYLKIKDTILEIQKDKKNYRFNVLGLITIMAHYHLKREKCFYCAEFVKYVLTSSDLEIDLPDLIKPADFQSVEGLNVVYTGKLQDYPIL